MIDILIRFLDLEHIDKQFIKKIPYHLIFFLLLTFIGPAMNFSWKLIDIQYILFISLFLFFISNSIFNRSINRYVENYMDYTKFDKFISQLTGILDGNFSMISEGFNKKRMHYIFSMILFVGGALLIFDLSLFYLIFYYLQVPLPIHLVLFGILIFYVYSDLLRLDYIDKEQVTKGKYSFEVNLLERFSVTNVMEGNPYSNYIKYPVFLGLRIFCPVISLKIEYPNARQLIIYRNEEVINIIKDYIDKKEGLALVEFKEQEDTSYDLKTILTNSKPIKLISILHQSPKISFPYLFDPEYYLKTKKDPKVKYTILKIVKKPKKTKKISEEEFNNKTETLGYIFIQLFQGPYLKTNYSKYYDKKKRRSGGLEYEEKFITSVERREIFFIFIVGQKDYIKGIEMMFESNSQKVPNQAMGIDMVDEK